MEENRKSITLFKKKRASSLKVYIKSEDFKLNLIPIPFWLSKATLSIARRIYNLSKHKLKEKDIDVSELLQDVKIILKELKNYPPFEIINVESKTTKVIIRTT